MPDINVFCCFLRRKEHCCAPAVRLPCSWIAEFLVDWSAPAEWAHWLLPWRYLSVDHNLGYSVISSCDTLIWLWVCVRLLENLFRIYIKRVKWRMTKNILSISSTGSFAEWIFSELSRKLYHFQWMDVIFSNWVISIAITVILNKDHICMWYNLAFNSKDINYIRAHCQFQYHW